MPILSVKVNKIAQIVKKTPRAAAQHLFWSLMVSFALASAIGLLVFYKYAILAEKIELAPAGEQVRLDERLYERLSGIWLDNEGKSAAARTKQYADPFKID